MRIKTEISCENSVVMLSAKDIKIQNIDHLGIVAGIVDSIGLVEIINNLLGSERGEKVSAGHVVKAMILNGLGFVSQPLYLFPKFFESIACEHLIGVGVKPGQLMTINSAESWINYFSKDLIQYFWRFR